MMMGLASGLLCSTCTCIYKLEESSHKCHHCSYAPMPDLNRRGRCQVACLGRFVPHVALLADCDQVPNPLLADAMEVALQHKTRFVTCDMTCDIALSCAAIAIAMPAVIDFVAWLHACSCIWGLFLAHYQVDSYNFLLTGIQWQLFGQKHKISSYMTMHFISVCTPRSIASHPPFVEHCSTLPDSR